MTDSADRTTVIAQALADYYNDRVDTSDPAYLFAPDGFIGEAAAIAEALSTPDPAAPSGSPAAGPEDAG